MPSLEEVKARIARDQKDAEKKKEMSPKQEEVVQAVIEGKNVFFTGPAGSGKSFLIHNLTKYCLPQPPLTAICAATGLAAVNIGGATLHSAMHIGLGEGTPTFLAAKIKANQENYEDLMRLKFLICDEISMIDAELFGKLEEVLRLVRENDKPFGGVQVILSGDFWQLPPVGSEAQFVFESDAWQCHILTCIELADIFR